jgi:hypothetical protein
MVGKCDPDTRCHLFLTNFYSIESVRELAIAHSNTECAHHRVSLAPKANSYYSNKAMGDELKYVLERKNKTVYIGNTLEKPAILLKREFVRDTDTTHEDVSPEGTFAVASSSVAVRQMAKYEAKKKRKSAVPGNAPISKMI